MNIGLFEIALLAGSAAAAIAGVLAAAARRRAAGLLMLNLLFAACFGYFAFTALRFGGLVGAVLGLVAFLHLGVVSAIVGRASQRPPVG